MKPAQYLVLSPVFMPCYLRPLRIISFNFCRIASMSGSAKAVSSVLTPFVFALVPLMALSSWAWLISPGGPWEPSLPLLPSLPRGMPKLKCTLLPSKLVCTVAVGLVQASQGQTAEKAALNGTCLTLPTPRLSQMRAV